MFNNWLSEVINNLDKERGMTMLSDYAQVDFKGMYDTGAISPTDAAKTAIIIDDWTRKEAIAQLQAAADMYNILVGIEATYTHCPICRNRRENGHNDNCKLALILKKAEGFYNHSE
jgi:hypothetical protein